MSEDRETARAGFHLKAWRLGDETFETHSGPPNVLPKHFHATYQIAITTRRPGKYLCDGRGWDAQPGHIIVFHPGEVHSTQGTCSRGPGEASRLIYVEPARLADMASSVAGRSVAAPVFDARVIQSAGFIARFHATHALAGTDASRLERDSAVIELFGELVAHYAAGQKPVPGEDHHRRKALLVRDFLHAHYRDNVSLDELAGVAHSSPYHLNRLFSREYGMPPHAFQTQVRIEHAKRLLLLGHTATETAAATGFYDQSHLARYFKRLVGVSPRVYAAAS